MKTKVMCAAALLTALIFLITRIIQIPIPLGYINIGNAVIMLSCILLPYPYGIFAAALGSALADLTSYPVFTLPTILIKALMCLIFYILVKKSVRPESRSVFPAGAFAMLIPVAGYAFACGFIYGSFHIGIVQIPLNFLEYGLNMAVFAVFFNSFLKLKKYINFD